MPSTWSKTLCMAKPKHSCLGTTFLRGTGQAAGVLGECESPKTSRLRLRAPFSLVPGISRGFEPFRPSLSWPKQPSNYFLHRRNTGHTSVANIGRLARLPSVSLFGQTIYLGLLLRARGGMTKSRHCGSRPRNEVSPTYRGRFGPLKSGALEAVVLLSL